MKQVLVACRMLKVQSLRRWISLRLEQVNRPATLGRISHPDRPSRDSLRASCNLATNQETRIKVACRMLKVLQLRRRKSVLVEQVCPRSPTERCRHHLPPERPTRYSLPTSRECVTMLGTGSTPPPSARFGGPFPQHVPRRDAPPPVEQQESQLDDGLLNILENASVEKIENGNATSMQGLQSNVAAIPTVCLLCCASSLGRVEYCTSDSFRDLVRTLRKNISR